ncbi:hypothetical protein GC175_01780 [bacterium]|nr:hypothetical protein [bacterium]
MERLERILTQTQIIGKQIIDNIPIEECGEPLLSVSDVVPNLRIQMTSIRYEYAGSNTLYARKSVCGMLKSVAAELAPAYELILFDAYRPIEYQRMRYRSVFDSLRTKYPLKTDEEIEALTFAVVFPPDEDPSKPPPHATGGAVDVAIASNGALLDFGSSYGIYNETENPRHLTNSSLVNEVQRQNREMLIRVMVKAGFSNYPGEWWHFMYGDREYAVYEGFSHAFYGRVSLEQEQL